MAIYFLAEDFEQFPDPEQADESGLLAVGGNLAPETLLKAYRAGIFPWYNEEEPICWFSPGERCVILRDKVRISKSMRQLFNKGIFTITRNQAFDQVIAHCATVLRPEQEGTWIVAEMQKAYKRMHALGHASSIEVWQNEKLVGGLYGIEQGGVFCGESMFSLAPNASKAALIHLCTSYDYALIDCQVENPHLLSMGAELMPRHEFLELLQRLRG
ncbi:MAG: leucyl/phenylalanyl-tRNA--protein transferase [Taibaiella sp.]|nr:leucyl/phenylalanyl-tRNA--protein transferase [Taibaiella sp.]